MPALTTARLFRAQATLPALFLTLGLFCLSNQPARAADAETFNRSLGSGINLGNALDAPNEGDWGVVLQPEYFPLIKSAGFKHVRVPISWSTHAAEAAPYTIDPQFFQRVLWAIQQARANGLAIIINMHHYNQLEDDPAAHSERFKAMWKQIAEQLSNQPEDLAFEFYNEPAKKLDAEKWNSLFAETLKVVRATNPNRCVVVGPASWNNLHQLSSLSLPEDRHLVATIHYYEPMHFTHQGASWIGEESKNWLGTTWTGSPKESEEMTRDFDEAAKWAQEHNIPMYLGEFGAYEKADMDSRIRWTRAVHAQAQSHGMSDAYWEFCSGFGLYDPQKKEWRAPLLEALRVTSR